MHSLHKALIVFATVAVSITSAAFAEDSTALKSATADGHTEAALTYIQATNLQTTFGITRQGVLERLETYKKQLLASPAVNGHPEAIKLTEDFMAKAKGIAEDVYSWDGVENMYVTALKETYTEDELVQINAWLATKYGKIFIAKQHKLMIKTIDIAKTAGALFQVRTAALEKEYSDNLLKIAIAAKR